MPSPTLSFGVAIALLLGIASLGLASWVAFDRAPLSPPPPPAGVPPPAADGMRSAAISTARGTLILSYAAGAASLEGTLSRSTPCVNWQVRITAANPAREGAPGEVTFDVYDQNQGAICIQVLGEPQAVRATMVAGPETWYVVRLAGGTVWSAPLLGADLTP